MISITIGGFVTVAICCFVAGVIAGLFIIALTSANEENEE